MNGIPYSLSGLYSCHLGPLVVFQLHRSRLRQLGFTANDFFRSVLLTPSLDVRTVSLDKVLAQRASVGNTHCMKTATLDSRRRLTMPAEIAPLAAVTIEQSAPDTWIVRRVRRKKLAQALVVEPLSETAARRAFRADPMQEALESSMSSAQSYPRP